MAVNLQFIAMLMFAVKEIPNIKPMTTSINCNIKNFPTCGHVNIWLIHNVWKVTTAAGRWTRTLQSW